MIGGGKRNQAELEATDERFPVVHVQGNSAIRRPLIILAVCAVGVVGYVARDFLIPTAAAIVLALMLTPVANTLERVHLPPTPAAVVSVSLLALVVMGMLSLVIPSIAAWAAQAPYPHLTLQRKLEGLRKSLAIVKQVRTSKVEQATSATAASPAAPAPEKVVVHEQSLLGQLASTTPGRDPADRLCRRAGLHAAGASQQPSSPDPAHSARPGPRACGWPA